jgi:uncharacterized iron-regulated protein
LVRIGGSGGFRPVAISIMAGLLIAGWNWCVMADSEALIVDLLLGEPIPMEMVLDDLAGVRIIYVGELHTIARHHKLQAELLRRLTDRNLKLALGMEMFSFLQQPLLDHWQKNNEPLEHLIRELGTARWTNLKDYEEVLLLARELKISIVGLNAPDALVRKVARGGMEALSGSERELIPSDADRINPLYDRLLRLRLRVHKAFEKKSLDRIVLAQAVRDAVMARNVIRCLEGEERVLLVIAGSGHLNFGFGIPERVQQSVGLPHRIILPSESGELVLSEEEKRQSVPVHVSHEELMFIRVPLADYLHVIPLKKEDREAPPPVSPQTAKSP